MGTNVTSENDFVIDKIEDIKFYDADTGDLLWRDNQIEDATLFLANETLEESP